MEKDLFLKELEEIENQYQKELNAHKSFNIVRAFHKIDDERRLHSRFIAYLLSPESKHGMGDTFLKKFIALIPQLKDFDLENKIEVFPNEFEKSEKYNIDILIINHTTNQAIIIENKINAKDSNRKNAIKRASLIYDTESTYSNSDQEDIAQLKAYFKLFKDKNEFGFKYDNEAAAIRKIQLVYLTLNRKDPSLKDQFEDFDLTLIDYRTEIKQWIGNCINDKATNHFLEEILRQYLDITNQLTNDVERAKNLKDLISKDIDVAWKNKDEVFNLGDFKHVKWHTVFDFWNELTYALINELNADKLKKIGYDEIKKQTHNDSKKPYGIVFEINGRQLYVMNDAQNGLTIGLATSPDIKKPKEQWDTIDDQKKFYDFTNKDTFELINIVMRKDLIYKTIKKIKEFTSIMK